MSTKARESKWKDGGSWDGVFTNWSAIPWADVKQNPNIMSCHCRFCCSMFCLASSGTGVVVGDSVVCEGCGSVGGECDDVGRSEDLNPKIEQKCFDTMDNAHMEKIGLFPFFYKKNPAFCPIS